MSDIAIRVENLSKLYRIGDKQQQYTSLRELVAGQARSITRRMPRDAEAREFWALKDVSFEVKRGDIVGVIGRNGAGKSTLLKILSRITEPTQGSVELHGRVGSLLEVGTGFHPELTGRENIFLNGAILGMKRAEIERRFDEIVDFAEIEKFLDTPVKYYSSGMYMRLAFSVAAHLESEILLIDEVLAVGDIAFQQKCLGKMDAVAKNGRTVFFVSHNMAAVSTLCSSAVVFRNGSMVGRGDVESAIKTYVENSGASKDSGIESYRAPWATSWIKSACVLGEWGKEQKRFPMRSDISFEMRIESPSGSELHSPVMGVVVNHLSWGTVGVVNSRMGGLRGNVLACHSAIMRCKLRAFPFLPGSYTVDLWLAEGPTDIDCVSGYIRFDVTESDVYGSGRPPFRNVGIVLLDPDFELRSLS